MSANTNSMQPYFNEDKNTKLHFAAARNELAEVTRLIDDGHKVDPENFMGWTPLMMATRNGHLKVVEFLLESGTDATRKNRFGISVFLMAIRSGNLEMLEKVLGHLLCGGVSKQSMESVLSPISVSILFNQEHVFRYLLQQKFNRDALTPITGLSPLMFAALNPNENFTNILLSVGANKHLKNVNDETAPDILRARHTPAQMQPPCVQHCSPAPIILITHPSPSFTTGRKCSNTVTPNYCYTPNVSPITPVGYYPQVFFPPDFSPNAVHTPYGNYAQMFFAPGFSPTVYHPPVSGEGHVEFYNQNVVSSPMARFAFPGPWDVPPQNM